MLCAWRSGRHIVGTQSTCIIELRISLRKIQNTKPQTLGRFPQYAKWWWGQNHDTSTLNDLCRYVWVCVWEEKQRCRLQPPFSSASIPSLLPSHTLDLVQISCGPRWSFGVGEGGRESFVSSAYWKCTVGFFPVWETIYAKLFPIFPYLSHLVSCLCFQLCVILFASCTELTFSQSLKTELTWLSCSVFCWISR